MMPRVLTPAIALALMLGFASSPSAETFVIAYASTTACDLSATPPENPPTAQPVIPPVEVPLGGSLTVDLCFIVWPPADSDADAGEIVCNPVTGGTGTESCAEQAHFTATGIEITGFTPTGSSSHDPIVFPHYHSNRTLSSLKIAGGHPLDGLQGIGFQGLSWGTVTLKGTALPGNLELQSVAGGYVNASMQNRTFPVTKVATTVGLCGDNVVDPDLEDCDDGNQVFGDTCSPNCKNETLLEVTGSVSSPGSGTLSVTIGAVEVVLDLQPFPNEPAAGVVFSLVENFNSGSQFPVADQINSNGDLDPAGRILVADEPITATLTGSQGNLAVPEPGHLVMLAAGIALLLGLERRRSARGRVSS